MNLKDIRHPIINQQYLYRCFEQRKIHLLPLLRYLPIAGCNYIHSIKGKIYAAPMQEANTKELAGLFYLKALLKMRLFLKKKFPY